LISLFPTIVLASIQTESLGCNYVLQHKVVRRYFCWVDFFQCGRRTDYVQTNSSGPQL